MFDFLQLKSTRKRDIHAGQHATNNNDNNHHCNKLHEPLLMHTHGSQHAATSDNLNDDHEPSAALYHHDPATGPLRDMHASQRSKRKKYCFGKLNQRGLILCLASTAVATILFFTLIMDPLTNTLAERYLNSANIRIEELTLGRITNRTHMPLRTTVTITDAGPFDADVDAMITTLLFQGGVLGTVPFPAVSVAGGSAITTVHIDLDDWEPASVEVYQQFTRALVSQASAPLTLRSIVSGSTTILGISKDLHGIGLDKAVPVRGLDSLREMQVLSTDPKVSTETEICVHASTNLVNPSALSLESIGHLSLSLYVDTNQDKTDGRALEKLGMMRSVSEVSLQKGNNFVDMLAVIKPDAPQTEAIYNALSLYLAGKVLVVWAVATDDTSSDIPLLGPGLKGLKVRAKMKLAPAPILVKETQVVRGVLLFDPKDVSKMGLDLVLSITIDNPTGKLARLDVQSVAIEADLLYKDKLIGSVVASDTPVSGLSKDKELYRFTLTVVAGVVLDPSQGTHTLEDFSYDYVALPRLSLQMRGVSIVRAMTSIGELNLHDLPLDVEVDIIGLSKLATVPVIVHRLDVLGGHEGVLDMSTTMTLSNPGNAGMELGEESTVHLDLLFRDLDAGHEADPPHLIGTIEVKGFTVRPGDNPLLYRGIVFFPYDKPSILNQVINTHLNGGIVKFIVLSRPEKRGGTAPKEFPFLERSLQMIDKTVHVPGIHQMVIRHTKIDVGLSFTLHLKMGVLVTLFNPLNCTIGVHTVKVSVKFRDKLIGSVDETMPIDNPIILPSQAEHVTRRMVVEPKISVKAIKALRKGLTSGVNVFIEGVLGVIIGIENEKPFHTDVAYAEKSVPSEIHWTF